MGIAELNNLNIEIYQGIGTTIRPDNAGDLKHATIEGFTKIYPGGLYLAASIWIPRDITIPVPWIGNDRLVIRNGLKIVWEGVIANINYSVRGGAEQGIQVEAIGMWGGVLGRYTIDKRWADTRITDEVHRLQETTGGDKCRISRYNEHIHFTPANEEWVSGEYASVMYTMPTGQTVKRVFYAYEFSELAEASPKKVFHYDSAGPTFTDLTNTYDGDTTTNNAVTITTGDYLYIDLLDGTTYNVIRVDMGATINANASVMTAEYPVEDTAGNITWTALTISDGTAVAGQTLATDGNISFTRPGDIAETSINSSRRAWVRLLVSANLTASINIQEITLRETQAWKLSLYNVDTTTEVVTITSTNSGNTDHTLASPSSAIELRFVSMAKQTPPGNDTIFAGLRSLTIYSETGSINLTEIAKDIRVAVSTLNSDETNIGSNTYSLVPFITNGQEPPTNILEHACSFGDSSQNGWSAWLLDSEKAASPDGKPVLSVAQRPSLSDYDYAIRVDEPNLAPPLDLRLDYDGIINWVTVNYRDIEGRDASVTPDYDSSLKDTTSITAYGERRYSVNAGDTTDAIATNLGQRLLAEMKNPKWFVTSPIVVVDHIRAKSGALIPACEIEPGKRIRIENFLNDLSGVTDAGLTFLITQTDHSGDGRECRISTGTPDNLAVLLSQMARGTMVNVVDPFPFGDT